jgi:hypothetical protein
MLVVGAMQDRIFIPVLLAVRAILNILFSVWSRIVICWCQGGWRAVLRRKEYVHRQHGQLLRELESKPILPAEPEAYSLIPANGINKWSHFEDHIVTYIDHPTECTEPRYFAKNIPMRR